MRFDRFLSAVLLTIAGFASSGKAATITLVDYGFNIDGVVSFSSLGDPIPAGVDLSNFDTSTGLGAIEILVQGPGVHYAGVFLDHEIDEAVNGFTNEVADVLGVAGLNQFWEIDEPGFVFGDIFDNFTASAPGANLLDTANAIDAATFPSGDDAAMAMAFGFNLLPGEQAPAFLLHVGNRSWKRVSDCIRSMWIPTGPSTSRAHTRFRRSRFPNRQPMCSLSAA